MCATRFLFLKIPLQNFLRYAVLYLTLIKMQKLKRFLHSVFSLISYSRLQNFLELLVLVRYVLIIGSIIDTHLEAGLGQ